jgi:transcriptional regulator with XRE-family HTH domain
VGEKSKRELARLYGVSSRYLTQFERERHDEIERIKAALDDRFAGLWIADKQARVAAYQADYELSLANEKYAGHHEHIRTRVQIQQAVAEELGDLPPRMQVTVMPVTHIIEGVDISALT